MIASTTRLAAGLRAMFQCSGQVSLSTVTCSERLRMISSAASRDATSPAAWPPMPSATR
jgi:hypothetical protein